MHLGISKNFSDELGTEPQMTKEGKHSSVFKYKLIYNPIWKCDEKGQWNSGYTKYF